MSLSLSLYFPAVGEEAAAIIKLLSKSFRRREGVTDIHGHLPYDQSIDSNLKRKSGQETYSNTSILCLFGNARHLLYLCLRLVGVMYTLRSAGVYAADSLFAQPLTLLLSTRLLSPP